MPNRIIKESIRTSDTLASVSAEAERLFWRLVTSADDFGRFDARLNTVLGQCLTPFIGQFSLEQVEAWLVELQNVDLIRMYTNDGQRYLWLTKWDKHQRPRAKASKFPSIDDVNSNPLTFDSRCLQTKTNDRSNVFENGNVFENENGNVFGFNALSETCATNENQNQLLSSSYAKRLSNMSQLYQSSGFGQINQFVKETLEDWLNNYPDEWIEQAFREAVLQNKIRPKYVNSILQNWKANGGMTIGGQERKSATTDSPSGPRPPDGVPDKIRQAIEEDRQNAERLARSGSTD